MTADLTDAKIEELVWVWEEHGIWICLGCHAAVPPADGGIERHYRRKHKLKGAAMKRVLAYEEELSLTLCDPHEVKLPANGGVAIDQLPVLRGLQYPYQPCDFLTVHPNSLTTHYACPSKGHREAISRSGGTRARPGDKVSLQSFSKGGRARYWVVSDMTADDNGSGDDSGYGSGFDDMLSSYGHKLASDEDKRRRTGEAPGGADVDNPWVSWTGWAEHFQDKDLAQICRMSKGPMSDAKLKRIWAAAENQRQRQLRIIADSFERVMARCTSRLKLVPRETLRWLNSIEPMTPHGKPVQLKDHESSMDDYKRYAARYLCYCFGAWQMGREAANTDFGVRFTDLQWDRLHSMVEGVTAIDLSCGGAAAAARGVPASTRQGRPAGDTVAASRTRGEEEREEQQHQAADEDASDRQGETELEDMLDRRVMEFWIASIKQKIAFNIFQNPLLHFTAVLGIDPEKLSYKRAADYTGQLAGLVWCVRLLMLEHLFEDQSDNPEELDFAVLERFQEEHHEWLAAGPYTPFSNIITYMAYGKGHREKEGGLPKVMWEDDEGALRFKGDRISVLEFRQAARRAVDDAEQLLDKLMFGHWAKTKAALDMRRIVDSLTFEGSGRSFATNHKNKWLQPGYKRVAKLGKEKLWREGKGKGWREAEVVEYLALLRRFKLAMMVCCHIWPGVTVQVSILTTD